MTPPPASALVYAAMAISLLIAPSETSIALGYLTLAAVHWRRR